LSKTTIYTKNRCPRYTSFVTETTPVVKDPATSAAKRMDRLPVELVSSAVFLFKRLGMNAKEQSLEAYESLSGLHPYHHAILALLDEGSRETQGAIADALGYDKGQLVGLLDELEDKGLVERQRDPSDRRRQIVGMTAAGRKTLGQLRQLHQRLEREFLAPLDDDERHELHVLLRRLAEHHLPQCRLSAPPSP
jgi:MarR family transcriptional regulator, lower aerobic nicotinate degradation pathway regulator